MQPLMLRYSFDAVDHAGALRFLRRDGYVDHVLDPAHLARNLERESTIEHHRSAAAELAGRVRMRFYEADGDYEAIAEEAVQPDHETHAVSSSELPLAMTRGEGRITLERMLSEARVARETVELSLPPSQLSVRAGDVIALPGATRTESYRVDRVELAGFVQNIEATHMEPETYRPVIEPPGEARLRPFLAAVPVLPFFMDLPLLTNEAVPHAR